MADTPIVNRQIQAAPKDYLVPSSQEFTLESVIASIDGTSAVSAFLPALQMVSPAGDVMWTAISPSALVQAGGTADVTWFPGVKSEAGEQTSTGFGTESLLVDTRVSTGATSATVLQAGQQYVITAQGTFSNTNNNLDVGTPNANAIFPTSPPPARSSTQVGFDPECIFAYFSGSPPASGLGHNSNNFQMNLGSGFQYVTPQDGSHSTPAPNSLYTYKVTGQGSTASFKFNDQPGQFSDNYGYIQVTIQSLNGSSGGGGGGSLIPPVGPNGDVLTVVSGVPEWTAPTGLIQDIVFVALPTGVANTDTANIQAAHDGLGSHGGWVVLGPGTYVLNSTGLAFSKPIRLTGNGGGGSNGAGGGGGRLGEAQTTIRYDFTTGAAITISCDAVILEDFALINDSGGTPTAGGGVVTVSGGGEGCHYSRLVIGGFWIGFDNQAGGSWTFRECQVFDYVDIGIQIQNVDATDHGASVVQGCYILQGPTYTGGTQAQYGILWRSGGACRIVDNKLNTTVNNVTGQAGIGLQTSDGVTTGQVHIIANGIEIHNFGIVFQLGSLKTGVCASVNIANNYITAGDTNISVTPNTAARYSLISILGNVMKGQGGANKGINMTNVDQITYGPDVFAASVTAPITVGGGVTNNLQIGNG